MWQTATSVNADPASAQQAEGASSQRAAAVEDSWTPDARPLRVADRTKRPEIMRLTGGPEFEVADGVLVILAGIVNIGAMSLEHETFFKTTTLIFAVGCFTLCIPGVRPASC